MSFSDKAIKYFSNIPVPGKLPDGISILNPYEKPEVMGCVKQFYKKYFNDNNKRIFIWGINPGRFGGGLTGISFTDPIALKEICGINNNFGTHRELSTKFIYDMINSFGGPEKFYSSCYLTALYPLAIIKNNINYNYYDSTELYLSLKHALVASIESQVKLGAERHVSVCLGKKNFLYLKEINDEYNFFERIVVLEHPRYIMQYKLKLKDEYIKKYLSAVGQLA